MEINITRFFKSANPNDYSGSIATHGPNAGPNTWGSAVSAFEKYPLINNNSKRIALRKHLAGFGAWEDSEINAWGNAQLNAMFLQLVSADMFAELLPAAFSADDGQQQQETCRADNLPRRQLAGYGSQAIVRTDKSDSFVALDLRFD